ncbi:Chemotaxis protein CheW [Saliniradius amylolyticus]|uniref:Chemotaxis protein CheW n=1 Tax=Saliniradius amylolyticus TaxID=2183582 RepID=A0A2S2E0X3_9ALTE|nr:chemotaxis protein CheV [Saliniradius amylolyticus]AWL11284.1 Chemotaxis protein CheW [Saliniradius amylolyticus]
MSQLLSSVDQRTNLVGENRLELLLFRLGSRQLFAMNVFKVREVIRVPSLSKMPGSHPHLKGVMDFRGHSVPIIDLRSAIRLPGKMDHEHENVIITEYNRTVQGFLIGQVMNIVNTSWSDIQPPPKTLGRGSYLTAITHTELEGQREIVEIIDVEKVLAEIVDYDVELPQEVLDDEVTAHLAGKKVLIVDDSPTARGQVKNTLSQVGIEVIECQDGREALDLLKHWADEGIDIYQQILMMFTDAEMPEMDGYSLTASVRDDARMKNLYVVLNTSLSGSFNQAMVKKVGCDGFISKFQPELLVVEAQKCMRRILEGKAPHDVT